MKTLLTLLTILFCLTSSVVWSETVSKDDLVKRNDLYYKKFSDVPFSGQVKGKESGELRKGEKEGLWVSYWDNGQLRNRGNYKDGEKEGNWVFYLKNGTKNEVWSGLYNQGTLFAVSDLLIKNGISYKDGVPFSGRVSGFFQGDYNNGKKEGRWSRYNHEFWVTGGGNYKDGLKDGVWFDYYDNGQLDYRGKFNGGKEDGPWITYWSNGHIYEKGNYKNGIMEGPWEFYDKFGQSKQRSGTYKNGVKVD